MMARVRTTPVTMSLEKSLIERLRVRAQAEGISLSALVNRELRAREATLYFEASERIYRREGMDVDELAAELAGDVA